MALVDIFQNGKLVEQQYFGSHDHIMNYMKSYEAAARAEKLKGLEGDERRLGGTKEAATFKIVPVYDDKGDFEHSRFKLEIEDVN